MNVFAFKQTEKYVKFGRKMSDPINPTLTGYKLVATVNHMGNQFSGHYTACSYRDNKWWMCNDSNVCVTIQMYVK